MNNKITSGRISPVLIIIIVVVLAAGVGIGFYFGGGSDKSGPAPGCKSGAEKGGTILEKEDFSIYMPEGWAETSQAPMGTSIMVVNVNEKITEPEVQKINFKSYYSVVYDSLAGRNKEDYFGLIKESLLQNIAGSVIAHEESDVVQIN